MVCVSGTIAVVGAVASAYGAVQQAHAASQADKFNEQIAKNNATIAQQNATFAGQEGEQNAATSEAKTRAEVGAIKANQAASGVDVNSGSDVDVRSSAAELGELNAITIRSNAARQAYGYQTQTASDNNQAQLDQSKSSSDETAGLTKAGSTLLTQGSSAYSTFVGNNSLNGLGGADYSSGNYAPVDQVPTYQS